MSLSQSPLPPLVSLLPPSTAPRELRQLHHVNAANTGLLFSDPSFHTSLSLVRRTPQPSTFLYNDLLRAHTRARLHDSALHLFLRMLSEPAAPPDCFTFPLVLKACAELFALSEGEQIHCMTLKSRFFTADVFVQSALLHMYFECGRVGEACRVFEGMPHRSVVTWNSMIDGFSKCGNVEAARRCFDEMPDRNIVSWNSMIEGCVRGHLPHEALELFIRLKIIGLALDEYTMVSVLCAISDLGLLCLGKMAHGYVSRCKFPLDGALGVSLINMYTKCGCIDMAFCVFSTISAKNVAHWTSIITGLAAHGRAEDSLQVFYDMLSSGVAPNHVTFVGVLSACSHGGLVKEGLKCFKLMVSCGIKPEIEHYGCLVDLLGRSGHLEEATQLVLKLPMEPGFVIWGTLLAACRNHGNVEIAEVAAREMIKHEPDHGSCYILLSNMYAGLGRRVDSSRIRKMMEDRGVDKVTGFSWIEVNGGVHKFVAGDKFHLRSDEIYVMLEDIEFNLNCARFCPSDMCQF